MVALVRFTDEPDMLMHYPKAIKCKLYIEGKLGRENWVHVQT